MKRILFLLLLITGSHYAKATHLMGGDIVAQYDSATNAYTITLTHYRDTMGIPMDSTVQMDIYHDAGSGSWVFDSSMTVPLNIALSTALLPSFPYGVEVGVYTVSLPFGPGKYRIVNELCCRNGAILNMTQPLNESMFQYTDLYVDALNNSTPGFLAMPVAYFPANQPAYYNPLPYDPDMDSIAWNLYTPISTGVYNSGTMSIVFNNVVSFSAPPADPSGPFTINPLTGEITWTPDTVGNFVQSFEVNEYKNGVQTGTIIRDMQYVIIPDNGNSSPNFQMITQYNTSTTTQQYNYKYYIPGQQVTFQIMGTDPDNSTLELNAYSQAFQFANPATFTTFTSGNHIVGTFSWTPPVTFVKDMIVVFRLRDGLFTKDFTLLLRKGDVTSVGNIAGDVNNTVNVFPNPASSRLNISLELEKDINGDITLYSSMGQKVKNIFNGTIRKGATQLNEDIDLAPGMYYMVVKDNGKAIKTVPVSIQ